MKTCTPSALPTCSGTILDVRTGIERKEVCLTLPHSHTPLDELDPAAFMQANNLSTSQDVYLLCRSGKRVAMAAEKFLAAGFSNVHVVEGGIMACAQSGLTQQQKNVISLERQVRIAAGIIVILGAILGFTFNTTWHLLSAFVGTGLVFAGVSDWCGMGLLLAKAPWNKE